MKEKAIWRQMGVRNAFFIRGLQDIQSTEYKEMSGSPNEKIKLSEYLMFHLQVSQVLHV